MSEVKRQQDNPSQDWQKADVRILGQILAAQNVVFTLPDTIRIAEFYAQILISIPGITACRVCLGGKSVLSGEMAGGVCTACEKLHTPTWDDNTSIPTTSGFRCSLADHPGMQVIAIDSYQHRFGFFVLKINQAVWHGLYEAFIRNQSSYVALMLENRWQKALLQKTNDELERKVEERTHDLTAANEALAASRLAVLDRIKEAVEARQQAEQANADLQREVAEHKQVEQEYRTLIESVPDLIVRYDLDLRRIYVNPAWEKASGLHAAEVIGVAYTDIPKVPSPVNMEYVKKLRLAIETGAAQIAEFTWINADGVKLFLEYIIVPEYDHHGGIAGVLAVGRDITERKRMEDELSTYRGHLEELVRERTSELEEAHNKARQYLNIAGTILVAIDTDGRVTLINQKGCEVLERAYGEIIGKDWFATFVPESVLQDVIRGFRRLMAGELDPVEYFENPVLTQGGQERLIAWHNVLLRDGEGHIIGTLSSGEDITERRRTEKQIISLNQDLQKRATALEAANKELDAFVYSVSHDLRAPLRHINGFLELLQKKAGKVFDERSRHYMDTISEAANKMGLLIDDLLSFCRMGRQAMSFQQVELGPLVHEVIRVFEPDIAGRDIEWCIGDLPAVGGDAAMLRIVFSNLIANALKFTRLRQQARIEIGSMPGKASEAVIFVHDNGVGFDMTYAAKLFGVFQRLHRAEEFAGTGIGLANVRRIIARHGGRTWAEGKPDQGATFYFALPQANEG